MNSWSNYHTHNNFCDGKSAPEDYVRKAVDENVVSLGFSSHAPLPFACNWCMPVDRYSNYLRTLHDLQQAWPTIEIYKGLEVDYIPKKISPLQFQNELDYTIGSIHFVDTYADGRPWEIDGLHTAFCDGLEKIFKGDIREVIMRYFSLTREMIEQSQPTILGHLDKIKIQNTGNKFFDENEKWYQEEITNTLDAVAAHGTIIEINTRGIYQRKSTTTYPSPWIIEKIRQREIPVTLSSDAHHPDDIVREFPHALGLLAEYGIKTVHLLRDGKWKPHHYDEHGIFVT